MMFKHSLLIGNGVNLIPEDSNDNTSPLNWKDLIVSVFDMPEYADYKTGFVDLEATSYPLKYERMINYLCRTMGNDNSIKNVDLEAKTTIINQLSERGHNINSDIARCIRDIPCSSILTTNYDTHIETCIRKKKYEYSETIRKKYKGENPVCFEKSVRLKVQDRPERWYQYVDIYHIHGIDCVPESICLGYLHYSDIVTKLRKRLIGNGNSILNSNIVRYLKKGDESLEKEYGTRFFDSNMDIIGLGLSEQEIDLWWILTLRARIHFEGLKRGEDIIQNTITYYDIHTERTTYEGYMYEDEYQRVQEELFSNMNIRYVPLVVKNKNGYKEQYISAFNTIKSNNTNIIFYETESNDFSL